LTSYNITLIPGDGIGTEVTDSARRVIEACGVSINWDMREAGEAAAGKTGSPLSGDVIESIRKNGVALKGPLATPVGGGYKSATVTLRKSLDLYANVRPCKTFPGIKSRYENIDLIIVRENTEDLYVGIERIVGEDAEGIKVITKKGSERIARYAFEYAIREKRRKVTAVHKANILKITDGLFLKTAREVAADYPGIQFEDRIVDALCMELVMKPEKYDVLVLPNLYGDIVSDLCSGLVGGLGVTPGVNIGHNIAIFEPVHGTAPDIAGKDIANPMAAILSGVLMLKYIGEAKAAEKIENALLSVIRDGKVATPDLGGTAGTTAFTDAVIGCI
jgi:isocitrate dehydrogenase (NAD+)